MDHVALIILAIVIEGVCAVKLARKFHDSSPAWKFFVPIYNILAYGKFSLLPMHYLLLLAILQAIDLTLNLLKNLHPFFLSFHVSLSYLSFFFWAVMVARIAARLGQGFWRFLATLILSAVASNLVTIACLFIVVPAFNLGETSIPWWADILALVIMSLPFISLAFDEKIQR
jgi:hypothetical protein